MLEPCLSNGQSLDGPLHRQYENTELFPGPALPPLHLWCASTSAKKKRPALLVHGKSLRIPHFARISQHT